MPMRSSCSRMCGTGGRRLGRVDRDAHHLGAGERQLLDLDRGADGVDRVGVGHRLHAHRRVAADRDDARAPAHARLARAARRRPRRLDEVVGEENESSRMVGLRVAALLDSMAAECSSALSMFNQTLVASVFPSSRNCPPRLSVVRTWPRTPPASHPPVSNRGS